MRSLLLLLALTLALAVGGAPPPPPPPSQGNPGVGRDRDEPETASQWLRNALADTPRDSSPAPGFGRIAEATAASGNLRRFRAREFLGGAAKRVQSWILQNKPSGSSAVYALTTIAFALLTKWAWNKRFKHYGLVRKILLHCAVSGLAISLASTNSLNHVELLGKQPSGKIYWWSYGLFLPFHVLYRLRLHTRRAIISEPLSCGDASSQWHIGGWPHKDSALPPSVQAVVDCTCELPRTYDVGPNHQVKDYLCIPLWDSSGPTPGQMEAAAKWAALQHHQNRSVLVHCAHGHGRSAAVLSAALVRAGKASSCMDAFRQIQAFRPKAKLNGAQRASLLGWARVFGEQWDDDAEQSAGVAPVAPAEPGEPGGAAGDDAAAEEVKCEEGQPEDTPGAATAAEADAGPPSPPRDRSVGPPV
uniref:Tyrosine specific protein phosphatases domain-containing protein n=1 Tax=Lotharella oceanica TaxID=641309 RepID=A0A7S2TG31_9EUKA|mmetsp:Transcript_12545/g.24005  ORF Transcript_12545/g.24005 Transcript_12545/m.24005 type:complete len:417 (+) Transcript_12545:175-1425(+)